MIKNQNSKKQYTKPQLTSYGSVEELTKWVGGGCGEFLGGTQGSNFALACKLYGPGDFGS